MPHKVTHTKLPGNVSAAQINRALGSKSEESLKALQEIGSATRENDHLLKVFPELSNAIQKSFDAHIAAVQLNNQVAIGMLKVDTETKNSGYELVKAQVDNRLNNQRLTLDGIALEKNATRRSESLNVNHEARELVAAATHSQQIMQQLLNLDHNVQTTNLQIADAEYYHKAIAALQGKPQSEIDKEFVRVKPPNVTARKTGFIGMLKAAVGI